MKAVGKDRWADRERGTPLRKYYETCPEVFLAE